MKKIYFFLTAVLIINIFCGKKTNQRYIIETIDNVEYVHNSGTPLHPEKTVEFIEDLTISSENEKGDVLIFQPHRFGINDSGSIFISDLRECDFKMFDAHGRHLKTIGRKGDGPGEFQSIGRFIILSDGRLLALDWDLKRISLFDAEGRFLNSHQYKGFSFDLLLASPSSYIMEEILYEPGEGKYEFKVRQFIRSYDLSGNELHSFGEFTAAQSGFINDPEGRFSYSLPYSVQSIFAGDNNLMRLYHCLNDKYSIEVYDLNGAIIRRIDRPAERINTTSEDMRSYIEGFTSSSDSHRALIEKHTKMPALKPITERMVVDDKGNLWVETNEKKKDEIQQLRAYDIFDPDGIYIYKVWLKKAPGLFKGNHMYRMEQDEKTGYRILKRYVMKWSEQNS